jgi:flagellar biosynthesis protein
MSNSRKGGVAPPGATAKEESGRTAVAIRYQPVDESSAPKVVASGRGWIAEKILEVAFAHGIKVREDADLAEVLAAIDLDEEIPVEAFIAVAEILRYVYAANGAQPPEVSSS